MPFDFDHPPDRRGSDSIKWRRYAGRDVLPLWVADMDFAVAPPIQEALERRIAHGVLGYPEPWPSLESAVVDHLAAEYGWNVDPAWLVWLPGLVTGLNVAARSVEGGAITATPVYGPFLRTTPRLVTVPLVPPGPRPSGAPGRWTWDLPALESALLPDTRLLLLCHPHNPVGRAWEESELRGLDDLAARHDLVVCSDEIHCGLVLDPARRHIPYAMLSPEASRRSITLMAPSKTWNVPGLGCAFAVIPDPDLRASFQGVMRGIVPHVNVLGLVACEAAYRNGTSWHRELIAYLRGNAARVEEAVASMPGLSTTRVEATYLAWIDTRETGLSNPLRAFEEGGVGLSPGSDFGPVRDHGSFVRLNFGCSRSLLDEALARMRRVVAG